MSTRADLAHHIFPNVKPISCRSDSYPARPSGQVVVRMAPSPTGFMHIGQLFMSLVNSHIAQGSDGIFFLRIEDTDSKREVEGAAQFVINNLKTFGITINEGPIGENGADQGAYGPYTQSQRKEIYHSYISHLIAQGLAYPCRMTPEELDQIREQQMLAKKAPGIYGSYSLWRNKTAQECFEQYQKDPTCVIRFRCSVTPGSKVQFVDANRGLMNIADNFNDNVIMKSGDKLPTYHLAHAVDDHLMGTTYVIRGEERLVSVPWHLQLFDAFGWTPPTYCHTPLILKLDNGKKRKMSKRSDPECSVHYLLDQGFTPVGVTHYLNALIDSGYEDRYLAHEAAKQSEEPVQGKSEEKKSGTDRFPFRLEAMNSSGSLFDLTKLSRRNNMQLSSLSHDEFFAQYMIWAKTHDHAFFTILDRDRTFAHAAVNTERLTEKDPKRYNTWADIAPAIGPAFSEIFDKTDMPSIPGEKDDIVAFLTAYRDSLNLGGSATDRFATLQTLGSTLGYAQTNAEYKAGGYKGKTGDLAMILRIVLWKNSRTPDLFALQHLIGTEETIRRINNALAMITK